jgi:hypothetical protein
MLDGVIEHYLQGVSEREFDMPLMALLLSGGYYDIHKLHGAFEFGKDFVAKRSEAGTICQYTIQSKAGDLNIAAWRAVRSQIDEARYNRIAHPSYDQSLRRKAILVTTGRLVGAAASDAQEYRAFLDTRGEISFEVWDRDDLREMLIRDPLCGLANGAEGELIAVMAAVEEGSIDHQRLERYTRRWTLIPLYRVAMEGAVIADKLRESNRADLAATTALCALRAARSQEDNQTSRQFSIAARGLHAAYGQVLLREYGDSVSEPRSLFAKLNSIFPHVTYPVLCCRLAEIFGLMAMAGHVGDELASEARSMVGAIVSKQAGIGRPISDRWAVSLMYASLAVFRNKPDDVEKLLESVIIWTCDSYQYGLGLASPDAPVSEEIDYLLGAPLSHVNIKPRRTSYLATVALDLCCCFGFRSLYEAAVHDFNALGVAPMMIIADESLAKWGAGEFGISTSWLMNYHDSWNSGRGLADHHEIVGPTDLSAWDAVALCSLPRNRHPFWAFEDMQ